jgi:hypothetical protein
LTLAGRKIGLRPKNRVAQRRDRAVNGAAPGIMAI